MYTLGVEVPTIREAQKLLEEGYKLFPGQWIRHLTNTGKAAELIAKQCGDLDPEVALVLGMLHDIGYRYGNTGINIVYLAIILQWIEDIQNLHKYV